MNLILSIYAPFSFDSTALAVAKERTITTKKKRKAMGTLDIFVNC
jgi:hypothetical protein